jgi:hypothetical protein
MRIKQPMRRDSEKEGKMRKTSTCFLSSAQKISVCLVCFETKDSGMKILVGSRDHR